MASPNPSSLQIQSMFFTFIQTQAGSRIHTSIHALPIQTNEQEENKTTEKLSDMRDHTISSNINTLILYQKKGCWIYIPNDGIKSLYTDNWSLQTIYGNYSNDMVHKKVETIYNQIFSTLQQENRCRTLFFFFFKHKTVRWL